MIEILKIISFACAEAFCAFWLSVSFHAYIHEGVKQKIGWFYLLGVITWSTYIYYIISQTNEYYLRRNLL